MRLAFVECVLGARDQLIQHWLLDKLQDEELGEGREREEEEEKRVEDGLLWTRDTRCGEWSRGGLTCLGTEQADRPRVSRHQNNSE